MRPVKILRQRLLAALPLLLTLCACTPAMRGSMALEGGDYPEALARYEEALRQDPDSAHLGKRLGLVLLAMKDYPAAEARFAATLAKHPGEPECLFYLGLARIGKGEREAALTDLQAFAWPFKYYTQKAVREEASRLRGHPELPSGEAMRALREALERGRQEQERYEIESRNMYD